jgi:hypothetical protein
VERLVNAWLARLDQWERLGLLSPNADNTRVGSGGYAYCGELPGGTEAARPVEPDRLWGSAAAQIFSSVSPQMHWEFALQYEMRWLRRWGLTYYGCCEPLDSKIDILRRIPNLRKVSMSPWVDPARGAAGLGDRYVYSCKPSPAILARNRWRPQAARRQLVELLEATRGCAVEIIMKDISTVRHEPQRLWEWADMAVELADRYAA